LDFEDLFDDIPLDKVSTNMTINAPTLVLPATYVAVARRQGVSPSALRGIVQNDILKEYVARGTYIHPPQLSERLITDVASLAATSSCPGGTPLPSVAATPVRQARRLCKRSRPEPGA
jgi:methylmalonyl-CoA mutase N-terminal domain/subunit